MIDPKLIALIDEHIARMQRVRAILAERVFPMDSPAEARPKRQLSAGARARIAAAQKARWARRKST